jgi:hypothetical protein
MGVTISLIINQTYNFRAKNKIVIEEATMGGFWMINTSSNVKIKVKRIS